MSNATDNPKIEVLKAGCSGVFTNYIYKAIPLAFDESMSYYETLAALLAYLKDVILPTVNNNAEAVAELQSLYEELNKYVDDYFKNLDVQEEINNKLDDLVEDGTLTRLIGEYVKPLLDKRPYYFDNVEEMKLYDLKSGDYVITKGYYEANDGGNAEYIITGTQPINHYYETLENGLYAILIENSKSKNVLKYGVKNDGLTDNTSILQNIINFYNNAILFFPNGQYNITGLNLKSKISIEGESLEAIIYNTSLSNNAINYVGVGTSYCEEFNLKNITISSSAETNVSTDTRAGIYLTLARRFNLTNVKIQYFKYGIHAYEYWYSSFTEVNSLHNDVGMYLRAGTPTEYYSCNIQENNIGLQIISNTTVFNWYGGQIGGNNINIFYDNTALNQTKNIKFDGVNFEEGRGDEDIKLGIENGSSSNGILVNFTLINCRFAHWTKLENNTAISINYGITNVTVINCEFTNYLNAIKTNTNYSTRIVSINNSRTNTTNTLNINGNVYTTFSKIAGTDGSKSSYKDLFEQPENINSLVNITNGTQWLTAIRNGKHISINFRTSSTVLSNGDIGTLDSSIAPSSSISFPCVGLNSGGSQVEGYGQINIKPSGVLSLVMSSQNCGYINCQIDYYI